MRTRIVEYGDFECPTCKQAAPAIKMLLEQLPESDLLRLPALSARGCASARATGGGSRRERRRAGQILGNARPAIREPGAPEGTSAPHAQMLGLDMDPDYTAEMDDHVSAQKLRRAPGQWPPQPHRATPTFFINGVVSMSSFGMQALHKAVEAAVARAHHM